MSELWPTPIGVVHGVAGGLPAIMGAGVNPWWKAIALMVSAVSGYTTEKFGGPKEK